MTERAPELGPWLEYERVARVHECGRDESNAYVQQEKSNQLDVLSGGFECVRTERSLCSLLDNKS